MPNKEGFYGSRDSNEVKIRNLESQVRLLRDEITKLTSLNVDMSGRRVINAKHSRHDHDYIIKAELNDFKEEVLNLAVTGKPPVVPEDLKNYVLDFTPKRLNYGSFTLDDITISREGSLINISNVDVDGIYVVAACIDEVTLQDYQESIILANIPSLDVTNVMVVESPPVTKWNVGDYILINNPYAMLGVAYAFEIFKITAIVGPAVTMVRDGSAPGFIYSWFNTIKSFHIGSFQVYRVQILNFPFAFQSGIFYNPTARTGFAERLDIIAPNMCVIGVSAVLYNNGGLGTWTRKCLSSSPITRNQWESEDTTEISPGLRTLNGAAYYFSTLAVLTVDLESDYYIRPNDTSPIRCIFGYLESPAETTGSTGVVITVDFIEVDESDLSEIVIETIEFYNNELVSGDPLYPPETRQLPYNSRANLIGDTLGLSWPVPLLRSDRKYKTKVRTIGTDEPGTNLVVVIAT